MSVYDVAAVDRLNSLQNRRKDDMGYKHRNRYTRPPENWRQHQSLPTSPSRDKKADVIKESLAKYQASLSRPDSPSSSSPHQNDDLPNRESRRHQMTPARRSEQVPPDYSTYQNLRSPGLYRRSSGGYTTNSTGTTSSTLQVEKAWDTLPTRKSQEVLGMEDTNVQLSDCRYPYLSPAYSLPRNTRLLKVNKRFTETIRESQETLKKSSQDLSVRESRETLLKRYPSSSLRSTPCSSPVPNRRFSSSSCRVSPSSINTGSSRYNTSYSARSSRQTSPASSSYSRNTSPTFINQTHSRQSSRNSSPSYRSSYTPRSSRQSSPTRSIPRSSRQSSPTSSIPRSSRNSSPVRSTPRSSRQSSPARGYHANCIPRSAPDRNFSASNNTPRSSRQSSPARTPRSSRHSSPSKGYHSSCTQRSSPLRYGAFNTSKSIRNSSPNRRKHASIRQRSSPGIYDTPKSSRNSSPSRDHHHAHSAKRVSPSQKRSASNTPKSSRNSTPNRKDQEPRSRRSSPRRDCLDSSSTPRSSRRSSPSGPASVTPRSSRNGSPSQEHCRAKTSAAKPCQPTAFINHQDLGSQRLPKHTPRPYGDVPADAHALRSASAGQEEQSSSPCKSPSRHGHSSPCKLSQPHRPEHYEGKSPHRGVASPRLDSPCSSQGESSCSRRRRRLVKQDSNSSSRHQSPSDSKWRSPASSRRSSISSRHSACSSRRSSPCRSEVSCDEKGCRSTVDSTVVSKKTEEKLFYPESGNQGPCLMYVRETFQIMNMDQVKNELPLEIFRSLSSASVSSQVQSADQQQQQDGGQRKLALQGDQQVDPHPHHHHGDHHQQHHQQQHADHQHGGHDDGSDTGDEGRRRHLLESNFGSHQDIKLESTSRESMERFLSSLRQPKENLETREDSSPENEDRGHLDVPGGHVEDREDVDDSARAESIVSITSSTSQKSRETKIKSEPAAEDPDPHSTIRRQSVIIEGLSLEADELKKKVQSLEDELCTVPLVEDLQGKLSQVESKLEETESFCYQVVEENVSLKQEIETLESEISEVQDTFREKDAKEFKRVKWELENLAKTCRNLQIKLGKTQAKASRLRVEKEEMETSKKSETHLWTTTAVVAAALLAGIHVLSGKLK